MLIGIVGKPNTGKSTFFSAATLIPVPIDNRPFTTINSNKGIAYVRRKCVCQEFDVHDQPRNAFCIDGVRLIPIELIDCAGLVPDAWQGKGLGNYFLDEIRKADALIHVIDSAGATDEEGRVCTLGAWDPLNDVKFLERELVMWVVQILKKDWRRISQTVETMKGDLAEKLYDKLSGLAIKKPHIHDALRMTNLDSTRPSNWNDADFERFTFNFLKNAKPMLLAANKIDLLQSPENLERLKKLGYVVIPCSSEAELILRRAAQKELIHYRPGDQSFRIKDDERLTPAQKRILTLVKTRILEEWGSTGVQEVLNTIFFTVLHMITVYPVENVEELSDHDGRILPDVFLVPAGLTAKEFAFLIHSDLGEGFIYALDARSRRRLGEDYVLKDGDVLKIVSAKARK
jgi:ribosome-binding ATPase YchF (GTP1/OBG family)